MKHRILLALIVVFSFSVFSQTPIIFDKTNTISYQLSYTQGGDQSQRILNDMLEIIARSMNKPVRQTRINFSVEEHVWVTRNGTKLNAYLAYENVRLSGDLFYKGFDVSDVFIPSHYSFESTLKRKNGPELKKFSIDNTPFRYRNSEHHFQYTDTITNGDYQFLVDKNDFIFRSIAFDVFRAKCITIDQYYGAEGEISLCYEGLNQINPENFRQLNKAQSQLDEMIARVGRVQGDVFWRELDLRHFDPISIYPKMEEVNRKISDLQKNISYVRSNLYRYYFDSGLQSYNSNKRNDARNDFRQSISLNNQYPQSYYYLALMEHQDKNSSSAMDLLSSFFAINQIDQSLYAQASDLAKDVEKSKILEIEKKISQQQYAQALSELDALETFCRKIKNYSPSDSLSILRGEAHNKIYQAHLNDAQRDFATANYDLAIGATNKALLYQSQFPQFIASNDQATAMMQKVNADYYLALVKRGRSLNTTKDYRNAFSAFEQASVIEENYNVKKDKQLAELVKKSKLEVLFLDVTVAQKLVSINNLPSAREVLVSIISNQPKYGLNDNAKLNQQVEALKQSIFSKQCVNAQAEYDGIIANAQNEAAKGDYILALSIFEKAKLVSDRNVDCQLNIESATNGVTYVQNPAKYQQDLNALKKLVSQRDFARATSAYNALDVFYTKNNLSEYTLYHLALPQFILQYGQDYILWGASYLANQQDYNGSYLLLESLRNSKLSRSKTKKIQQAVANGFAIADYKTSSSVNEKVKVLEYTKGDKWYKYFAKQYQKQIKSFKK